MPRNDLHKLNPAQLRKLRELYRGRTASEVVVDEVISKVWITFGEYVHVLILGPRGRVITKEIIRKL